LGYCMHLNIPTTTTITATCPRGTPVSQLNPGNSDVSALNAPGTYVSTDYNSFTAGATFLVPAGDLIYIPVNFTIIGDLVLLQRSVLHVGGNLQVSGHIYMDAHSSLLVDKTL